MPLTWNAIYLGTFPSSVMDPNEGNDVAEGASLFQNQTYGSASDPLFRHIVSVTALDRGGDSGALDLNNNSSNDRVRVDYTPNDGSSATTTSTYDASIVYNAVVTFKDGTTQNVTAVIMQTTDGRLFLAPEFSNNADSAIYESGPIQSITLGTINGGNSYSGLADDRNQTDFVCFAAGTMIETETGDCPVEDLCEGDMVVTMDHGAQPIQWIKARTLDKAFLDQNENLRPIRIAAGALGAGMPLRDLVVSPQHRVLVRSKIAIRMFDSYEVLIAAKHLCSVPGIDVVMDLDEVTYVHMMFDRHQVIFSEGTPTESLYPGSQTMNTFDDKEAEELFAIFPALRNRENNPWPMARPFIDGRRGRRLAERHVKNSAQIVEEIALRA